MGLDQVLMILLLILHLISPCIACPPQQRDALFQFSHSFVLHREVRDPSLFSHPCDDGLDSVSSYPKTASWNLSVDCCGWPGVTCDESTGNVVALNLKCSWLQGTLHPNTTLFHLSHLRSLDLSCNNFLGSTIPAGIGDLEELTHLNLSRGHFNGHVPSELYRLNKLTSLDISFNYNGTDSLSVLRLEDSSMEGIARNLSVLRFLDLSGIYLSNTKLISFMNVSSELTSLRAKFCGLEGELPKNIFHLPNLRQLDLSGNDFIGTLPESNWTTPLESLDLSDNFFRGRSFDSLHQLKNLKGLRLDDCGLTGLLPSWLGNQTGMTSLRLTGNFLIGHIPWSLGNLNQLIELDLSDNQLSGKVDLGLFSGMRDLQVLGLNVDDHIDYGSSNYSFSKLEELYLSTGNLTRIPYFIRSLDRLRRLDLSGNKISGSLPSWFWNVSRDTLEILRLEDNHIEGSFQLPWPNLNYISLENNLLQGPLAVPPPSTWYFDVSSNNFTGTIDNSFCLLHSLWYFDLRRNKLFGTLPSCLGNSTQLWHFDLSDNNFQGKVPRYLTNSTRLYSLNLSYNSLEDTIPSWLGESTVQIPFKNLDILDISNNNFQGSWPAGVLQQSKARFVDLSDNHFHGPIPLPPPNVYFFSASNNMFSGKIPSMICSATDLQILNLSNNSLEGNLPPCLINSRPDNSVLNLRMNKIGGIIPEILLFLSNGLRTLDLSLNRFTGTLPRSLVLCGQLQVLDLSNNQIEDTFPNWLGELHDLRVLILRSNKFHGVLNTSHGLNLFFNPFPNLRILDLSANNFSGLLPGSYFTNLDSMITSYETMSYLGRELYKDSVTVQMKDLEIKLVRILSVFKSIDLSGNGFWGAIPAEIGMLKYLKGLNLSHNSLTGRIPTSLGNLSSLEWLDLSANKLDGIIPQELSDLTSLAVLNLSENLLTGRIPTGRQFNTFNISSFSSNPMLCGFPLLNSCSKEDGSPSPLEIGQDSHGDQGDWMTWGRAALIGCGPGLVLGISLGYIFLETGRPTWVRRFVDGIEAKVSKMITGKHRYSNK